MTMMPGVERQEAGHGNEAQTRFQNGMEPKLNTPWTISVNCESIWTGLMLVAVLLWLMHFSTLAGLLAESPMPGRNRFHLDVEGNLPTFFSSFNLMVSAVLLGLIAVLKKNEQDQFAFHWTVLCGSFFLASLDEVASIHELFINPLHRAFGLSGYLRFGWVLLGAPLVLVFAYAYSRFLLALPRRMAVLLLLSGGMYVAGAIGFEMVGANAFDDTDMNSLNSIEYLAAMTAEEILEMSGILLFIRTLLGYLRTRSANFTLRFN